MNRADLERQALRAAPDVVHRRIAGEEILVPVRSGAAQIDFLFTANDVGTFIFGLLDGRHSASEVARRVGEEFEVDPDRALGDVLDFLQVLYEARLAVPVPEEAR